MASRHRIFQAREKLKRIERNPERYLVVHYSCESFYEIDDGHTPRVTSIAVMSLGSGQVESFSISKVAEQNHVPLLEIKGAYDSLELKMLDEFFDYVESHLEMTWVHWNMRDINYGFRAIEHRYAVLGGNPRIIPDTKKVDLSMTLPVIYGKDYADHPRLPSLLEMNPTIANRDFLSGAEEAEAYESRDFAKLHQSTLRKVHVFADIIFRAIDGDLKTNETNDSHKHLKAKPVATAIVTVLSVSIGTVIGFAASAKRFG